MLANGGWDLTLILLMWTTWRDPTNASKWRMGFNSAFKGLICPCIGHEDVWRELKQRTTHSFSALYGDGQLHDLSVLTAEGETFPPPYPLNRGLGGPRSRAGRFGG